jgi:hypothetical protein
MQSLAVYGRFVVRAVLSELAGDLQASALPWYSTQPSRRAFHLVTAASGLSKSHSSLLTSEALFKQTSFGDDACFVVRHKLGDVLGVYWCIRLYLCHYILRIVILLNICIAYTYAQAYTIIVLNDLIVMS